MEMKVRMNFDLTISVDGAEMRLILSALANRLRPEQIEPALALQKRLAEARLGQMKHITNEYQKLVDNINEAEREGDQ